MSKTFPKDCTKECPHYRCWDLSIDDYTNVCDKLHVQVDDCDAYGSFYVPILCPLAESEEKERMSEQMEFPESFEKFVEEYGFYANGSDLIPIFRVKQWLEHDNKLRTIETDTAYECGKRANKWIPVSDRLPEPNTAVLIYVNTGASGTFCLAYWNDVRGGWEEWIGIQMIEAEMGYEVLAWMSLPEPYTAESEEV